MKTTAKITAMLLVLALVGSVSAKVITVEVTGVVDSVSTQGGVTLDGSVNIGSVMTGIITYDTDAPDQVASEGRGTYPVISISMTVGNYTFTHDTTSTYSPLFYVSTGDPDPSYWVRTDYARFDGTIYIDGSPKTYEDINWNGGLTLMRLYTSSSEYITTDALPDLDSWPELSVFDVRRDFSVGFSKTSDLADGSFGMSGEITSLTVIPEPPKTYYVDAVDGNDNNDGTSWANAYNYLQDALAAASSGDEIWVAEGIYTPDSNSADPNGSGDREATFQLISGVAIYGGFSSGGSTWEQRDPNTYETILSGDLDGDEPNFIKNSYHVTSGSGTDATAVLDGFTITAGNANGSGTDRYGSGMYNQNNSSPTVTNCTFSGNWAGFRGGGMANWYSSPTVTNCTFSGNSASYWGGGMDNYSSSPTVTNCTFSGNSANDGGGMDNWYSDPNVTNCTFRENSASLGGGIHNGGSDPTLTNCIFSDNSARFYGGGMVNYFSSIPTVTNCTFSGNSAGRDGGGMDNYSSSPTVTNCTFSGNSANDGGGMVNYKSVPKLTNCILWGNTAADGNEIALYDWSTIDVNYCDVEGGQEDVYVESGSTINWGSGNIDADPCFVEPGYWADANDPNIIVEPNDPNAIWVEGDYHLLRTSPCVDAGTDANVYTDIEGNIRPFDFPGVDNNSELPEFDMGAYELVPVEAAMKFTPQMLNCNSKGKYVKAHLTLPEEFSPEDVDVNEPAMAEPMGAKSEYIKVLGAGPVRLEICFDREAFCAQITDTGEVEITVIGSLTTSRYFYATDTIKIKP